MSVSITLEPCRDNYVVTCTPAPKVDLPECDNGWEIGNGTAVCATAQPTQDHLATTGVDATGSVLLLAAALVAIVVGSWGVLHSQVMIRREQDEAQR